jgi:hypothetical protein
MNLFEQRQFEEAAADDEAAATRAHVEAAVVDIHTSGPGIVQSFDATKQTAVVKPVVQKFFRGHGFKPLPPLMDVPVQFPRGGGFVLTFPVKAGDECLLVFAERAIDHWHAMGGVQPPSDFRTHSLSDAFAIMGVSSLPNVVPDFNASAVELRSLDGAAKVQIDGGGNIAVQSDQGDIAVTTSVGTIKLNAPPGATPVINGVLNGSHPCPVLGAPHGSFGPPCARVLAGST